MVLLHNTMTPDGLKDYRPISLIHSVGKLFVMGLALRLAPRMAQIVKINQSAFIRGRRIHENFRAVQLSCRWLHVRCGKRWFPTGGTGHSPRPPLCRVPSGLPTRQRSSLPSVFFTLDKESSLLSVFFTLGEEALCLGKENFKAHFEAVN